MKKIKGVFIRHGTSQSNIDEIYAGRIDVPLAKKGEEELLALKNEINYPETDRYFCSSLKRAKSTFDILYDEKEATFSDIFAEIYMGELEYQSFGDYNLKDIFSSWYDDNPKYGVEDKNALSNRAKQGLFKMFDELSSSGKHSFTLVSHFCLIRHMKHLLKHMDKEEYLSYWMLNGRGFVADIDYDEKNRKVLNVRFREI